MHAVNRGNLWFALAAAMAVVAVVLSNLLTPVIGVAIVGVIALIPLIVRWPFEFGAGLVILGPLFASTFSLGPLTADNAISAGGALVLAISLSGKLPRAQISGPILLPIGIVVLLTLSMMSHGIGVLFNVARFLGLVLLVLAIQLTSKQSRLNIQRILNCLVTLSAALIVTQPLTGWPAPWGNVEGEGLRYGGLYGHPNFAAYTLAIFSLFQIVRRGPVHIRLMLSLAPLTALMLSGSRTAILVFGAVVFVALCFRPKVVWPFAVGSGVIAVAAGTTFLSRFEDFFQTGGFSGTANAGGWRVIQWQYALDLVPTPNLWGIGWGNSEKLLPLGLGVHNGYLQFYVETGIIGTIIFGAALTAAFYYTRHSLVGVLLWLFAAATTFFDPVLMYPATLVILLALLSQDFYSLRASAEVSLRSLPAPNYARDLQTRRS